MSKEEMQYCSFVVSMLAPMLFFLGYSGAACGIYSVGILIHVKILLGTDS